MSVAASRNIVAGILDSPALTAMWARHHVSRRAENPASAVAEQIRLPADEAVPLSPDLLAFMREVVAIERKALGAPKKREEKNTQELRAQLTGLERFLIAQDQKEALPRRDDLPEAQREILAMLERQTGQGAGPVRATLHLMKDFAVDLYREARAHPLPFYSSAAFCASMIAFMNWRMGTAQTSYMPPELAAMTELSLDDLSDPGFVPQVDYSLLETFQPSCHDHLVLMVGQNAADFLEKTLGAVNLFPQHCIGVKTLALNAQNFQQSLWGIYDGWNARMHPVIKGLAETAGSVLPDSHFQDAFNRAADTTENFVYSLNWMENMTLHTVITAGAFMAYRRLRSMESEERQALYRGVRDFWHRTTRNYPLGYILAASGSAYAYMAAGGFTPHTLWAGIFAGSAGLLAHKFSQRSQASALVAETTITVRKDLSLFANPSAIVSDARAGDALTEEKSRFSGWKKAAIGVGAAAAGVVTDFAFTGGQMTGAAMGASSVVIPFLYYNVPEDTVLHWVFSILGTGLALAWEEGFMRPVKAVSRSFSKHDADSDCRSTPDP